MKGVIFNIQRYSLHDGNGIRTLVFFKGCPLNCPWCCNPESKNKGVEVINVETNLIQGTYCKKYTENGKSKMIIGQEVSIKELLLEIEKDIIFYKTSNGGVTLSGGEILSQAPFAINFAKELKKLGINVVIETSGAGRIEHLLKLADYTDTILFDLKIIDNDKSNTILNIHSEIIIYNFLILIKNGYNVIPRIPLIPNYTMDIENINNILNIIKKANIKEVHLLPFHQYGSVKYNCINKKYELYNTLPPSKYDIQKIKEIFKKNNIKVNIGGK